MAKPVLGLSLSGPECRSIVFNANSIALAEGYMGYMAIALAVQPFPFGLAGAIEALKWEARGGQFVFLDLRQRRRDKKSRDTKRKRLT